MLQRPLAPAGRVLARVTVADPDQPAYRTGLALVVLFVVMLAVLGMAFVGGTTQEVPRLSPAAASQEAP